MALFLVLVHKLIPLYVLIALGYLASRLLKVPKDGVALLLIYVIGPAVVFSAVLETPLTASRLSLPVLFFLLCCIIGLSIFYLTKKILTPTSRAIACFACASGNTGFFGLPMTLYLLGEEYLGLMVLCALGFILFENSLGFYLAARGQHSARASFQKALRLPTLYAVFAGLLLNVAGVKLTGVWRELSVSFRGAYAVLGMFMIGLAAGDLIRFRLNRRFLGVAFFVKFLVWPLIILLVLFVDGHFLHFYDAQSRRLLPFIGLVPMPAISVAIATVLNTEPEDVAVAVLLTTVFALFYIPFAVGLLS